MARHIEPEERYLSEEEYERELSDAYGTVNICGLEYDAGRALRELDPIAFRCGISDNMREAYLCPCCNSEYDTEAEALECWEDCDPEEWYTVRHRDGGHTIREDYDDLRAAISCRDNLLADGIQAKVFRYGDGYELMPDDSWHDPEKEG